MSFMKESLISRCDDIYIELLPKLYSKNMLSLRTIKKSCNIKATHKDGAFGVVDEDSLYDTIMRVLTGEL